MEFFEEALVLEFFIFLLDRPYADILEMPIFGSLKYRFQSNVNNYRHFLL